MTDKEIKLRAKLEKARFALKVIHTWAAHDLEPSHPLRGKCLDADHVKDLCEKTLKETAVKHD